MTTNYFKYWRSLNSIGLNSQPELQKLAPVTRKMILTLSVLWRIPYPKLLAQITPGSQKLLIQSHEAFVADSLLRKPREREAAAFNGEIVSDIECEDPEVFVCRFGQSPF